MLAPKTQYNLTNAKAYFEEHLAVGDYYSEGERVSGLWVGIGAERIGLTGSVKRDEFLSLCENLHPSTGAVLTQRLKTTRIETNQNGQETEVANRRIFYDFTFSPPKSVSIVALVRDDPRITEAHNRAIVAAVKELEKFATTRVRQAGSMSDRTTGNVVCAIFGHNTSRALDPHLHSHCILFNATYDPVEQRWKALQNYQMLRVRKYVEDVYYHELARDLLKSGYEIRNNRRGDFEIVGVPEELCRRFSKRHEEIDVKTEALLIKTPALASRDLNQIREIIAQHDRDRKVKSVTKEHLTSLWLSQISAEDRVSLEKIGQNPTRHESGDAQTALAWAEEHIFDRHPIVDEHELWRHALEHARGQDIAVEDLHAVSKDRGYIRDPKAPWKVTSREALEREWEIICMAKHGLRKFRPFSENHSFVNPNLDPDQRQAVKRILSSRDLVTLFRGGAGTGKSYALREIAAGLLATGYTIQLIAPQRQQAMAFEKEGFSGAQTVSQFLTQQRMAHGSVVIVDEAGQIGGKQMQRLLQYVVHNKGRIILSGDTRQHGAVEASDALWAIEKYSGLRPAELTEIRRQDPEQAKNQTERKWLEQYKQAVREASEGKIRESFDRLNAHGAVLECGFGVQRQRLIDEYLDLSMTGHSNVIVSQTWSEIHRLNEQIREGLKSRHLLGELDQKISCLEPVDLTNAQKRDKRFYDEDAVLVWNRRSKNTPQRRTGRLVGITESALVIDWNGQVKRVAFKYLDHLTVCRPRELTLSKGDRLQLKANGRTKKGQRLANGELVTVENIGADGRIRLQDGRVLEEDFRRFLRGYAVTSYASQGKTVDYVLFSDSAVKAATDAKQWCVTVSRGRKGVRIFTQDKVQLRENITRSGNRGLAMDLADKEFLLRMGISPRLIRSGWRLRPFALGILAMTRRMVQRRTNRIRQETQLQAQKTGAQV